MPELSDPPGAFDPGSDKPVAIRGEGVGAIGVRVTGLTTEAAAQQAVIEALADLQAELSEILS